MAKNEIDKPARRSCSAEEGKCTQLRKKVIEHSYIQEPPVEKARKEL